MRITRRWTPTLLLLAVALAGCDAPVDTGRAGRAPADGGESAPETDGSVPAPPPGSSPPPPSSRDGGSTPRPVDAGSVAPADAGPGEGGGEGLSAAELDLLQAINDERASGGLAPVAIDDRLLCAARRHALDVGSSGSCGHVGSDGSWPWDRAMACGFPQPDWTVNEIAAGPGFTDGADAVWGWRHSSGHYAALMHERAATVGVAVHETCFIALFDCCVAGSE